MFADLLKTIAEEADRNVVAEMAKKYPSLQQMYERGERFDGIAPTLKALSPEGSDYVSNPQLAINELAEWRDWKTTKWTEWQANRTADLNALTEAREKLAVLEAKGDIDMTPDEVKALVDSVLKERGVTSKADVEAVLGEFSEKRFIPTLNTATKDLATRFEQVYETMTPLFDEHKERLGEKLDVKAVFKHMNEQKVSDPMTAYNSVYQDKFTAKQKADQEKAVTDAEQRGIDKGRREAAAASGRSMPVDGSGSVRPGALVSRYREKEAARVADGKGAQIKLGSGMIAAEAAREHYDKATGTAAA